jgi:hypothetical protein
MCLPDRRCDTRRNYISPVARNLRSNLPNQTNASLVKIAQFSGGNGRQRHARAARNQRSVMKGNQASCGKTIVARENVDGSRALIVFFSTLLVVEDDIEEETVHVQPTVVITGAA